MRVSATYECGHTTSSEYSHSPGEYRAEAHSGNCSACLKPSAEAAQEAISVTADQAVDRVKVLEARVAQLTGALVSFVDASDCLGVYNCSATGLPSERLVRDVRNARAALSSATALEQYRLEREVIEASLHWRDDPAAWIILRAAANALREHMEKQDADS